MKSWWIWVNLLSVYIKVKFSMIYTGAQMWCYLIFLTQFASRKSNRMVLSHSILFFCIEMFLLARLNVSRWILDWNRPLTLKQKTRRDVTSCWCRQFFVVVVVDVGGNFYRHSSVFPLKTMQLSTSCENWWPIYFLIANNKWSQCPRCPRRTYFNFGLIRWKCFCITMKGAALKIS